MRRKRENPASAEAMVRTFHDREPYWTAKWRAKLPQFLHPVGTALETGYWSDKWEPIGEQYQYIHTHGSDVIVYAACNGCDEDIAAPNWPMKLASLGYLWKCQWRDLVTDEKLDAMIPRDTELLCVPSGKVLVCMHPTRGFYAAIMGGDMFVGKDGIEN